MQQCTSRREPLNTEVSVSRRGLGSHCWMHPSMKYSNKSTYSHFLSMSPSFDNNCCVVVSSDSSCWATKTLSSFCPHRHLPYIHLFHPELRLRIASIFNALFLSHFSAVTSFLFQFPASSTSHLSNTKYGLGTQERSAGASPTTAAAGQPGAKRSRNATSE